MGKTNDEDLPTFLLKEEQELLEDKIEESHKFFLEEGFNLKDYRPTVRRGIDGDTWKNKKPLNLHKMYLCRFVWYLVQLKLDEFLIHRLKNRWGIEDIEVQAVDEVLKQPDEN